MRFEYEETHARPRRALSVAVVERRKPSRGPVVDIVVVSLRVREQYVDVLDGGRQRAVQRYYGRGHGWVPFAALDTDAGHLVPELNVGEHGRARRAAHGGVHDGDIESVVGAVRLHGLVVLLEEGRRLADGLEGVHLHIHRRRTTVGRKHITRQTAPIHFLVLGKAELTTVAARAAHLVCRHLAFSCLLEQRDGEILLRDTADAERLQQRRDCIPFVCADVHDGPGLGAVFASAPQLRPHAQVVVLGGAVFRLFVVGHFGRTFHLVCLILGLRNDSIQLGDVRFKGGGIAFGVRCYCFLL
eukprot:PhM_4_TR2100/c2_g1_i9/m.6510